ncbi:MAG: uroporphyrinogen decarboxylase [Pirellulales bacterium]
MSAESPSFSRRHVAAFESRRCHEMTRLIQRLDGVAHVSPAMREVPIDDNQAAVDFAHRLMTGQIDVVVVLTGTGFRQWISQIERHVDQQRFLNALGDVTTVARGPKTVVAFREQGVTPTHIVPEPNSWREILGTFDRYHPVSNHVIGLVEYGEANTSLIAGLEARGAKVCRLQVYRWALPLDRGPLEANVRAIGEGRIDVALFTSAIQVTHLIEVADAMERSSLLREQLKRMVIGSIGPTTGERLRRYDLPVDLEPEHPNMGQLVRTAAARTAEILSRKTRLSERLSGAAEPESSKPAWYESPFMKACRCEPTSVTPVWLMRQAGRYMAEYREVRAKTSFLDLCRNPQLASEVMLVAVERLGVDAAIIFSDLLPILQPMGLELEFARGEGPIIHNPVREAHDVDRVLELESIDALDFVTETVRQTRADLPAHIPLIGFSGAPFTLASYAIEGGSSRSYLHTKTLMLRDPGAFRAMLARLARAVSLYLNAQIASGAQAVQLFDSWIGCLGPDDYRTHVLPHMQMILRSLPLHVPVIHFGTGNPALLPVMAEAGQAVMGIDWRVPLDEAWRTVGTERAVQGNLDPAVLLATREVIDQRTEAILDQAANRPGHIFNLGHGVLQPTPVDNARYLVDRVHELSSR